MNPCILDAIQAIWGTQTLKVWRQQLFRRYRLAEMAPLPDVEKQVGHGLKELGQLWIQLRGINGHGCPALLGFVREGEDEGFREELRWPELPWPDHELRGTGCSSRGFPSTGLRLGRKCLNVCGLCCCGQDPSGSHRSSCRKKQRKRHRRAVSAQDLAHGEPSPQRSFLC